MTFEFIVQLSYFYNNILALNNTVCKEIEYKKYFMLYFFDIYINFYHIH